MSSNEIVAVIAVIGVSITAISSIIAALITASTRRVAKDIHILVNSRMTELLESTKELALAQGIARGEQSERDRASVPTTIT